MKQFYTLWWLLPLFSIFIGEAQSCPETLGDFGTNEIVHFKIEVGSCEDYPDSISIQGSLFNKMSCNDSDLKYQLSAGSPLSSDDTFSVEFGFGTCDYLEGVLRRETLSIESYAHPLDGLKIFPNPLLGGDTIHLSVSNPINARIFIFDITGKAVLSTKMENTSSKLLNLSSLNNGIYLLQIATANSNTSRKVVVMK